MSLEKHFSNRGSNIKDLATEIKAPDEGDFDVKKIISSEKLKQAENEADKMLNDYRKDKDNVNYKDLLGGLADLKILGRKKDSMVSKGEEIMIVGHALMKEAIKIQKSEYGHYSEKTAIEKSFPEIIRDAHIVCPISDILDKSLSLYGKVWENILKKFQELQEEKLKEFEDSDMGISSYGKLKEYLLISSKLKLSGFYKDTDFKLSPKVESLMPEAIKYWSTSNPESDMFDLHLGYLIEALSSARILKPEMEIPVKEELWKRLTEYVKKNRGLENSMRYAADLKIIAAKKIFIDDDGFRLVMTDKINEVEQPLPTKRKF